MTRNEWEGYVQSVRISDAAKGKLQRTETAIWTQRMRNLSWSVFVARRNLDAIREQAMRNEPAATALALEAADAQLTSSIHAMETHRATERDVQERGNS